MVNIFQNSYEARLQDWFQLRNSFNQTNDDILDIVIKIDDWWQAAPLINHHLHPYDAAAWPNPWELLSENTYCELARALGICYTLLLVGIDDVKLVSATNEMGDDVFLVLVDGSKHVLNYWPNTVISNTLTDFTVREELNTQLIKEKIRNI